MKPEKLKVLLIGNGGREHTLAWKLSKSPLLEKLFCVPGNSGTALVPLAENVAHAKADDFGALVSFAQKSNVDLVVVGPEVPLVNGIEGHFREAGIRCFGPTKAAARMEGSKTFAKDFMARWKIPTARYCNFSIYEDARRFLDEVQYNVVLKATGLAAGKGVLLPSSKEEAHKGLKEVMLDKNFGDAGDEVVIEEYLTGQELSFLSFSDGYTIKSLVPAQDHKQIFDNDQGPNTGGMGCYAPTPIADERLVEEVHRTILQPTIDGMRVERMPMKGLLFTGIMVTKDGPKTLEYNTRFGDPETQTLLPLMEGDLIETMLACTDGYLDTIDVKCKPESSVTVVAAAAGYPGSYERGKPITISAPPSESEGNHIFHAGASNTPSGTLQTSGGRVLAATSTAPTLETALSKAYKTISTIHWSGMHYRKDIAHRALPHPSPTNPNPPPLSSPEPKPNGLTYASAGVSITTGNTLISLIKPLVAQTSRPGAPADLGGFGGTFDLHSAGYTSPPTLVSGTDGVGTKLKIAQRTGKHDTIGIDLVAMCANDVAVMGAEVLWFMDTYSCHRLDVDIAVEVIRGIVKGCVEAGCALIGGETAEMGDIYDEGGYDLVGSTTGAIKAGRKTLPDKESMVEGDVVVGLASSGCHSNGFSLVLKILERAGLGLRDRAPWEKEGEGMVSVGESLLTPTRIYVRSLYAAAQKDLVKGMAHITGGGLVENVPRMLPKHLAAEIDAGAWEVPEVFRWLKRSGGVQNEEMARVFNMGLGMVLVVGAEHVEAAMELLKGYGETVYVVGKLTERKGDGCVVEGMKLWDE